MQNNITKDDIKLIVTKVGREGAMFALEKSTKISIQELSALAKDLDLSIAKNKTKKRLSEIIVKHIDKRINKTVDELKLMNKEELVNYFQTSECDQEELFEILEKIDLKAKAKSRRALIEYAAIQIQSLGVFERLSGQDEKKDI
jgi:hypothetical protein